MTAALAFTSVEDYKYYEAQSAIRHEYRLGDVVAMAGGSPNHNRLISHLHIQLGAHLRRKKGGCEPFTSDMMVSLEDGLHHFYPDISVACKPFEYSDLAPKSLLNFNFIVEVLSPSTMRYDLTGKLAAYQQHPTLKQIVFIDSEVMLVASHVRSEGGWIAEPYLIKTEDLLTVKHLDFSITLADIYAPLIEDDLIKPFEMPEMKRT